MSLPYFRMYPTDFEADTSHLTLAEDGAYNRLLRLCWMTPGCSLPNDESWIMRRMRVRSDEEKEVVRTILAEFFTVEKQRVSNPRLIREYQHSTERSNSASKNGAKGGRPAKPLKTNETKKAKGSVSVSEKKANQNQNQKEETHTARGAITFMLRVSDPPSTTHIMDAVTIGLSKTEAENVWPNFRDHHIEKGSRFEHADQIDAAWRKWCRIHLDRGRPRGGGPGGPGERRNAYSALAEEIGRGIERASQHDAGYAGRGGEQDEDGAGGGVVSFDLRRACG